MTMRPSGAGRLRALGCALVIAAVVGGCGTPAPNAPSTDPSPPSGTRTPVPSSAVPGSSSASPGSTTPSPSTTAAPVERSCTDLVEALSLREQVGQLLMVGVSSAGITAADAAAISRTRTGSVILLGNTTGGRSAVRAVVAEVRRATRRPEGIRTVLAADQEGGLVQRLKGPGFSTIPSARVQAARSPKAVRRDAEKWGRQLIAAGIDADLAPVADVVPAALTRINQPIGQLQRGYGSDPRTVAAHVAAFTTGMQRAGVMTAVKHYPGLGRVRGNTDFVARVVDTTTRRKGRELAGFDAAVAARTDMVMVSSAYYARIDPDHRAAFSTTIIETMLRGDQGFTGVVISDDLAAAAMRDLAPGTRAVRFVEAGGDLAIVGTSGQASTMATALRDRAADDDDFRARVEASALRVVSMKARRGLADCAG